MTDLPWEQIINMFIYLCIALVPVGVTISLCVALWKFWIKVTGLH